MQEAAKTKRVEVSWQRLPDVPASGATLPLPPLNTLEPGGSTCPFFSRECEFLKDARPVTVVGMVRGPLSYDSPSSL